MVAVYLPLRVSFLILNVALPLALVVALKVLFLILMINLTFLIGVLPDFKLTVYFLTLVFALKVFFLATILETFLVTVTGFLTVTFLVMVKPAYQAK